MELGPYAGFILGAYAAGALVVGGLTLWILADHRAQLRLLADLERQGLARRSAPRRQEVA